MQGHFDILRKEARGLGDEHFLAAMQDGSIHKLIESLETSFEMHQKNQVHDAFPTMMFRNVFGRFGNAWYPHDRYQIPLFTMCLQYEASEPVFYYHWGTYTDWDSTAWSIGDGIGAAKIMDTGIDPVYIFSEPNNDQEAIHAKFRFLWLPSEGNSNEIRSVGIFSCENNTTGNDERGATARVRLKDAAGDPITLVKTPSQVLLIQYTFTLVSL